MKMRDWTIYNKFLKYKIAFGVFQKQTVKSQNDKNISGTKFIFNLIKILLFLKTIGLSILWEKAHPKSGS